jgi:hypothetical protein
MRTPDLDYGKNLTPLPAQRNLKPFEIPSDSPEMIRVDVFVL